MVAVIVLCIVTSVLVIADVILVYSLRVLNNKVVKLRFKKPFRKTRDKSTTTPEK